MAGPLLSLNRETAHLVVDSAVDAVQRDPGGFHQALDRIPAALYVADAEGTVTYIDSTRDAARNSAQIGEPRTASRRCGA